MLDRPTALDVHDLTIGASEEEMLGLCLLPCSESDWTVGHLCGSAVKSCGEKRVVRRCATGVVVRQRHRTGCARAARFGERDTLSRDAPRSSQPRAPDAPREARPGKGPRELKLGESALWRHRVVKEMNRMICV